MGALATQLWFIAFAFASRLDTVTGQIPGRARLARRFPDEVCEIWDLGSWDAETGSEVVEEADFELRAGLGEAEHDVAGLTPLFADGQQF